jgi:hypothetical protein
MEGRISSRTTWWQKWVYPTITLGAPLTFLTYLLLVGYEDRHSLEICLPILMMLLIGGYGYWHVLLLRKAADIVTIEGEKLTIWRGKKTITISIMDILHINSSFPTNQKITLTLKGSNDSELGESITFIPKWANPYHHIGKTTHPIADGLIIIKQEAEERRNPKKKQRC